MVQVLPYLMYIDSANPQKNQDLSIIIILLSCLYYRQEAKA